MTTGTHSKREAHFHALEEARDAVVRLETLKLFLTPQDEETLGILMDKKLMTHLGESLAEAKKGKLTSLKGIL